ARKSGRLPRRERLRGIPSGTPIYAADGEEPASGQTLPDPGLARLSGETDGETNACPRPAAALRIGSVMCCNAIAVWRSHGSARVVLLGVLLASLAVHVAGVSLDFIAAIRYPF